MCLAIPGKIKEIEGQKVVIDYLGETREALAGGEKVRVGDNVLVQMGVVVKILTNEEAEVARKAWE